MFWIRTTFYQFHNYCYYFIAIQFYLAKYVFSDIEINQPGGRFDILINYANLDSTVNNGDYCDWSLYRCDVYMIVNLYGLVGRESRLLLHWKTKTVANTARYAIKLSETIYENLPEKYRLELRVYDEDGLDENDLITNATGLFQPNTMNSFQIVPLNYYHSSNGFSLSSSIKLTCNSNYYGSSCDILCVPQEWEYKCDNNGRKICAPGRYGINCSMTDYCRISPCPKNTRCKNLPREHSYKCICKDYEGPECHSVYYSCENLPCKNGGHCALLSDIIEDDNAEKTIDSNQGKDYFDDETICICPDNWSGEFCTQQVTECIPENEIRVSLTRLTNRLCLNGGVCIIHPGNLSARCSCPPEWDGYFCELSKSWSTGKWFGISFAIIFIIFLIFLIGSFIWLYLILRRRSIPQYPAITYTSNFPYNNNVGNKNIRVYVKHGHIFDTPTNNSPIVNLCTFGKNTNSQLNSERKIQNDYEVLCATNGTKQYDDNVNTAERSDSSFRIIQSSSNNIYANCNNLLSTTTIV